MEFMEILECDLILNGLVEVVYYIIGSLIVGIVVCFFLVLVLIILFLGVVLGLFEVLEDLFKCVNISVGCKSLGLLIFLLFMLFVFFYL